MVGACLVDHCDAISGPLQGVLASDGYISFGQRANAQNLLNKPSAGTDVSCFGVNSMEMAMGG